MVETSVRFDRFVLIACALGALISTGLTLGAADVHAAGVPALAIVIFIVMGVAPYGVTAMLSAIRPFRRLVLATTRAVAVIYGVLDCGLRYLVQWLRAEPVRPDSTPSQA